MTRRFLQSADVEIDDQSGALLVKIGDAELKVDMAEVDVAAIVAGIAGATEAKTLSDVVAALANVAQIPADPARESGKLTDIAARLLQGEDSAAKLLTDLLAAQVNAPSWTDTGTEIVAPVALGRGGVRRGTIDLRATFGAYLFLGVGRGGTTALTNGVGVEVRRTLQNGGILMPAAPHFSAISDTAAAIAKQINHSGGYSAGTSAFVLDGTGTPAADEDLCFWGKTSAPGDGTALPDLEFLRTSKFSSPTLTVDAPCKAAKIDDELLTNKANGWSVWCPGGCVYEVIFDYGDDAAGEAVAVVAYAQTYDSMTKV